MKRLFTLITLAAILAGCAAPTTRPTVGTAAEIDAEARYQRELAVQQRAESLMRLYEVSGRLRVGAAELCEKNVVPYVGLLAVQAEADENGAALKRLYALGDEVTALHVAEGSPAMAAGLQANDVITAIAGKPITDLKSYENVLAEVAVVGSTVSYDIARDKEKKTLQITPVVACNYPAYLTGDMILNAYADGKKVILTQGMMNFARTDEELALVVSHEIAHNMMKHLDAKKTNAMGGLLFDLALAVLTQGAYRDPMISNAAAGAYSQEFESEADYVGLYIMARSGYKVDDAPKFWRRMAVAHPGNIKTNHTASHPSTAARMVALDSAVTEIKGKQSANLALVPNMKEKTAAQAASQ